jgi:hypothetical protein
VASGSGKHRQFNRLLQFAEERRRCSTPWRDAVDVLVARQRLDLRHEHRCEFLVERRSGGCKCLAVSGIPEPAAASAGQYMRLDAGGVQAIEDLQRNAALPAQQQNSSLSHAPNSWWIVFDVCDCERDCPRGRWFRAAGW